MLKPDSEWDDNDFPLAYFIIFRTYGTWLHGDERRSVDTHDDKNVYGAPDREPNANLKNKMKENMKEEPITVDLKQRRLIKEAIKEVCNFRGYRLLALNVRTNHVHVVVSAARKPESIAEEFKKFSTIKLRNTGNLHKNKKLWSRGRSRKYLWKQRDVDSAINYVLYGQGDSPFNMDLT